MTITTRFAVFLAMTAALVLSAPAAGAAPVVELLRTGEVDHLAPSGSWCFPADYRLRPGGTAPQVLVYGRSARGQGSRQGRLVVKDASRFELNAGQVPSVNFTEAGNTPYAFWLGAKPGTPAGIHTVTFQVQVSDGSLSNEVSCRVNTDPPGVSRLAPPKVFVKNPYSLVVSPPSFADSTRSQTGGSLGGMTTGTQRRQGTGTQGTPRATPETLIKLEARVQPGQIEPPAQRRYCVFEAVSAEGVVRFRRGNHCEALETKLPADVYTLRLTFGFADAPGTILGSSEVRGYIVAAAFARVLSEAEVACVRPCTLVSDVCTWPGSGSLAFSCRSNSDCAADFACVSGECIAVCPRYVGCAARCEMRAGVCTEKQTFLRPALNTVCDTESGCERGYSCIGGQCRRPCG